VGKDDPVATTGGERSGAGEDRVVDLGHDLRAPALARRATRQALQEWRLGRLADRVVLVVSELVGNVVTHGGRPVGLTLRRRQRTVSVAVHDGSARGLPPVDDSVKEGSLEESGRGLYIVQELADDVSVEQVPGDGKIIRADFRT
jgi:anti-sigma regulatory factor (Ser/Thr protein kinase)